MTYFDQLFEKMPNGAYRERPAPTMAQSRHVTYIDSLLAQTRFDKTGLYYTPRQEMFLRYKHIAKWANGSVKTVPNYSFCIGNAWIPQAQVGNKPAFY